jgi:hypothetical protein
MGLFDAAFDQMSFEEICYRLPGELAVNALKRRITNLDTLLVFFASCGTKSNAIKELKAHMNSILNAYSATDILTKFEEKFHPALFGWVDNANKERLKTDGRATIDTKLLFNMTGDKDIAGLNEVLDRVLKAAKLKQSAVLSVLHKADTSVFSNLINRIVRDARPEVRCLVLSVGTEAKRKIMGANILLVGLKALAKSTAEGIRSTDLQDFNLFAQLKPGERLIALEKYLAQFPAYRKVSPFASQPTDDEIDMVLFAGCVEQNDLVVKLRKMYDDIAKNEPPEETNDDV